MRASSAGVSGIAVFMTVSFGNGVSFALAWENRLRTVGFSE
jgi:hypothetical protein